MAVIIAVGSAVALAKERHHQYQATAQVLTQPPASGAVDPTEMATEIGILQSQSVASAVDKKLGTLGNIDASQAGQSAIINVTATSASPSFAANVANAWANAYVAYRQLLAKNQILASTAVITQQLNAAEQALSAVDAELVLPKSTELQSQLLQQQSVLIGQEAGLQGQLQQAQAQAASTTVTPVVLTPAVVPTTPTGSSLSRAGLLGLGIGLLVGVLLALLFEYLDDSILTRDQLEDELGADVRVFGTVPEYRCRRHFGSSQVITIGDTSSTVAEAYRGVRTALHFAGADTPGSVIEVIAPTAGEGATTTASNLAVLIARAGCWAVLVDANLRHPRLHELFEADNTVGLTSVLHGAAQLAEATRAVPGLERVSILPAGPIVPNASELVASPRMAAVVQALRDGGATVIIDCPPLLASSDGVVIAGTANAVLLVTSARGGTRRRIRRAIDQLRQTSAPLVGVILNRAGKGSGIEWELPSQEGIERPSEQVNGKVVRL
jgi:capsular exopolysaccharide synthesis family protein